MSKISDAIDRRVGNDNIGKWMKESNSLYNIIDFISNINKDNHFKNSFEMDEGSYHAHENYISYSKFKHFLKSPLDFQKNFFKKSVQTEEMLLGSAIHCKILEAHSFDNRYDFKPEFGDLRTKEAKDKRVEWEKNIKMDVKYLPADCQERIRNVVESVKLNKMFQDILNDGTANMESSIFYKHESGLSIKSRIDLFTKDCLLDVKTTNLIDPMTISKKIYNDEMDTQLAFYAMGLEHSRGTINIDHDEMRYFIFFVQTTSPYHTLLCEIPRYAINEAKMRINHGLKHLRKCVDDNVFLGYSDRILKADKPKYINRYAFESNNDE